MKNLFITVMFTSALVFFAVPAAAGPQISLQTEAEWTAALAGGPAGTVRPMTAAEFSSLTPASPTGSPFDWPGTYSEPTLAAVDLTLPFPLEGGEELNGPGLVMSWGSADTNDYTAAWRFEYPADPNIVGQVLTATVCPPQFTVAGGQMNSIGFGFTDAGVPGVSPPQIRTYTWGCAAVANPATNTIAWNQNWTITIGPVLGAMPPAFPPDPASAVDQATGLTTVAPIFFSAGAGAPFGPPPPPTFNPTTVMFLDAYENGGMAGSVAVPPGGLPNVALWNWWQNVVVTPEPTTMVLLCGAGIPMLLRRRRRS